MGPHTSCTTCLTKSGNFAQPFTDRLNSDVRVCLCALFCGGELQSKNSELKFEYFFLGFPGYSLILPSVNRLGLPNGSYL
jgi:hypothetical protein